MTSTMHENAEEFRARVIEIAGRVFPELEFEADPEADDVVVAGQMRLGLHNLRAKCDQAGPTDEDLATLVAEHFGPILRNEAPSLDDLTLEELREQLRLQLMPAEYAEVAPLPIISLPFAKDVSIGIVADFPQAYAYVRRADLKRWDVTTEEIYEMALENLEELSRGLDMHLSRNGTDTFLAINAGDGYDAARILSPRLQDFIATHLGETFRFGIPNRDFLICWRLDSSAELHQQFAEKIAEDHSERPYALSPSVFVRNSEGNFHEQAGR